MDLEKINITQKYILSLYKKLLKILEDNNIPFFAIGGTAIGALRHKGFIPWDDDLDIAVPEEYIEKIKRKLIDNKIATIDIHSNTNTFLYEKIYDPKILTKAPGKDEGWLWIDIFGAYDHRNISKRKAFWKIVVEYILYIKTGRYLKMLKEWKWFFILPLSLLRMVPISKKKLRKIAMNTIINKKNKEENGKWYLYHNTRLDNFFSLKKTKLIKVPFEDTYIYITENFAEDSKPFFGNVYKIPKEQNKFNHDLDIIKNEYK